MASQQVERDAIGQGRAPCVAVALVLSAALCAFEHESAVAQDTGSLRQRFLSEAPRRWEEYISRAKRLQGTVSTDWYELVGGKRLFKRVRSDLKQRDGSAVWVLQRLGPDQKGGVAFGVNPMYAFDLARRSPDTGWVLTGFGKNLEEFASRNIDPPPQVVLRGVCNSLVIEFLWLPELILDPDCKFGAVRATDKGAEQLVRVDFEYVPKAKDGTEKPTRGWFLLNPREYWTMREYETTKSFTDGDRRTTVSFTHKQGDTDYPILLRMVKVIKGQTTQGPFHDEVIATYDLREQRDVPESEFRLSAFGLPEPFGTESRPTPWYWWAAGAGIVCIVLGGFFMWLKRRATSGPST